MARTADASVAVAAQQIDDARLTQLGLTRADLTTAAYWIDANDRPFRGAVGIGRALTHARQPWRAVGYVLCAPPVRWIAQLVYPIVVRYRHRLPGATDACRLDP